MAKYSVTHACSHTARVDLVGSHESREWRLKRMAERECFECFQQKQLETAQQDAKEQELPPLHGTEKQVAWAETLRVEQLYALTTYLQRENITDPLALQAVERITEETTAHQWIEWRDLSPALILRAKVTQLQKPPVAPSSEYPQAAVFAEATLRPEKPVTETVAELRVSGNDILVHFPEHSESFRELVRFQMGYQWNGTVWSRTIAPKWNGTATERAADMGRVLLGAGFSVRCFDESIRAKIVSGEIEPEQTRWIIKVINGKYIGWFCLQWSQHEDYYTEARKIKASRYVKPHVVVPSEQFEQVLDFAQQYDFRLSPGAQKSAEDARKQRDAALVVHVELPKKKTRSVVGDTPSSLDVPEDVEVDEEFQDDDD